MASGLIIDGTVFDASLEAKRIVSEAERRSAEIVAQAERQSEALLVSAAITAAKWQADSQGPARGLESSISSSPPNSSTAELNIPHDGAVTSVIGLTISADIAGAQIGEQVFVERAGQGLLTAEVVGIRQQEAILMPFGPTDGLAAASRVWRGHAAPSLQMSEALFGRVVDGLGRPIDGGPPIEGERWSLHRAAPAPLQRQIIDTAFATGIRAIDGALTLGRGQRIGLFAAAGVGKSVLLRQIASRATADVVVICQVGERGREVRELLDGTLAHAKHRTVAVCATSDASPLERVRGVQTATAIAEWFRDRKHASVLLLVDSLTRVARAQREVGLSAGEPVARHGYPPSVFALLPKIVERAGTASAGSITAVYTVLVAGDDMDEPIADEVRGLLDGHIVLDRAMSERGEFPPIDIVRSSSRVMTQVITAQHQQHGLALRARRAVFDEHRDLITLGAYKPGQHAQLDEAVRLSSTDASFLRQTENENADYSSTVAMLATLAAQSVAKR
jgi:ATP synthase in type III secretion protein N